MEGKRETQPMARSSRRLSLTWEKRKSLSPSKMGGKKKSLGACLCGAAGAGMGKQCVLCVWMCMPRLHDFSKCGVTGAEQIDLLLGFKHLLAIDWFLGGKSLCFGVLAGF